MTRDEADRQLKAMLLLTEPWTPEQWRWAMELHHIHAPGRFCFGKSWCSDRMFYEWRVAPMRDFTDMPAMSLEDFKRELSQ